MIKFLNNSGKTKFFTENILAIEMSIEIIGYRKSNIYKKDCLFINIRSE